MRTLPAIALGAVVLASCTSGSATPEPPIPTPPPPTPLSEPQSVVLFDDVRNVRSVSVGASDGEALFAIEHAPELIGGRPYVDIVGALDFETGEADRYTLSRERLLQTWAHLPVVLLRPAEPPVILTKQSVTQPGAAIEVWTTVDDVLGRFPARPLPLPQGQGAGRAQIVSDPTTGELVICWREQTGLFESEEDTLLVRGPDATSLAAQAEEPISTDPGVIEDHCDLGFADDGTLLTVFHRADQPNEPASRLDTILLSTRTPGGAAAGPVALPLPEGFTGGDFPSLASDGVGAFVAAMPPEGDGQRTSLVTWSCASDCADPAAWVAGSVDPPGPLHIQPRAVRVRGHDLLFYVTLDEAGYRTVQLSTRCAGETGWTHHPPLVEGIETAFTAISAGSPRTVVHDPTDDRLTAAMVEYIDDRIRAQAWTAPLGRYCPEP